MYASISGALAAGDDRSGIIKIYPMKDGGMEWFIDMDDPKDVIFDPRTTLEKQPDDS